LRVVFGVGYVGSHRNGDAPYRVSGRNAVMVSRGLGALARSGARSTSAGFGDGFLPGGIQPGGRESPTAEWLRGGRAGASRGDEVADGGATEVEGVIEKVSKWQGRVGSRRAMRERRYSPVPERFFPRRSPRPAPWRVSPAGFLYWGRPLRLHEGGQG